jgi:uncharacterized membrane protein YgcG
MKRLLLVVIALLAVLPLFGQDDERILSFDSHIVVNDDGSMLVKETITVQSTGEQIRHGITRDFPTRYDRLGLHFSIGFEIESVLRDGREEAYHTSDLKNGVRVYFGQSDYELPPGKHTYVFTYRTSRQLGFHPDHDELYWNVTGLGWVFPIDVATATVVLPERVRNVVTGLDGYTGYEGSKDTNFTATRDKDSNPVFRAENLLPHQGLSLVVSWPKGLIREPTKEEKRKQLVIDNQAIVVGLGGLVLVFVYFLVVWMMVGRDPAAGTIVPLYEPQDNLSPAGMRYLERMSFDGKVFTAAILGLAAKGYLTVEQEKNTYRLRRKPGYGPLESKLSADEKGLARKLFADGDKLDLTEHNSLIQETQKALQTSLQAAMEKTYFFTNQRYLWPGVALTAIAAVVMILMSGGTGSAIFMCIWLTGWSAGVSVLMAGVFHAWRGVHSGAGAKFSAMFITLFSLPFLGGEIVGIGFLWSAVGILPIVIIAAGVGINILFHFLLKAPTLAGRSLMDRVEGFRLFLKTVDGDRMNRMAAPAKTPELFERFLPYALALGVEHAWAQQFSQVLAAAAASASSGTASGYSPSWYSGAGFSSFSPSDFTSSFSDSFSSAVSSSSSPASSSSGSGGGGSSGGGGGGGGGGGW